MVNRISDIMQCVSAELTQNNKLIMIDNNTCKVFSEKVSRRIEGETLRLVGKELNRYNTERCIHDCVGIDTKSFFKSS